MTACVSTFPFQFSNLERFEIFSSLIGFGIKQTHIIALSEKIKCDSFFVQFSDGFSVPDYTPAIAIYLRDHWRTDRNTKEEIGDNSFADEMRALGRIMWGASSHEVLDGLLAILDDQASRLPICWELSKAKYSMMPVNAELIQAVRYQSLARNNVSDPEFSRWVTEMWVPMHLRYYANN